MKMNTFVDWSACKAPGNKTTECAEASSIPTLPAQKSGSSFPSGPPKITGKPSQDHKTGMGQPPLVHVPKPGKTGTCAKTDSEWYMYPTCQSERYMYHKQTTPVHVVLAQNNCGTYMSRKCGMSRIIGINLPRGTCTKISRMQLHVVPTNTGNGTSRQRVYWGKLLEPYGPRFEGGAYLHASIGVYSCDSSKHDRISE